MVKSLTVHKSQIERTRRKAVREQMVKAATDVASQNNVRAYAIVALTDDGRALAAWDTGQVIPMWAFASTVQAILQSDMEMNLQSEDFRPPLVGKAWG